MSFLPDEPNRLSKVEYFDGCDRWVRLIIGTKSALRVDEQHFQGLIVNSYQSWDEPLDVPKIESEVLDEVLWHFYQYYPDGTLITKLVTAKLKYDVADNFVEMRANSLLKQGVTLFAKGVKHIEEPKDGYTHLASNRLKYLRETEPCHLPFYLGYVTYLAKPKLI